MSIKVPTHLCRNRHGTTYLFRLAIPKDLRSFVNSSEVRLTLATEQRQVAIMLALPLVGDMPRMLGELRRMSEHEEKLPSNYFQQWLQQIQESVKLRSRIESLEDEIVGYQVQLFEQRKQIAEMTPRDLAKNVLKLGYTKGQLKGRIAIEEKLVFPWPSERTVHFSELGKAYINSFSYRASKGRRKPPSAKAQEKYEKDIALFIDVMLDVRIGAIDREFVGEYFKLLKRLPANMKKLAIYREKSIAEILAMRPPPQSEVTISGKLSTLSTMFKWAIEEKNKWGIGDNPFSGYSLTGDTEKTRRPFTTDELLDLLKHKNFINREFKSSYSYWLIPLALFTGARLGELCQLDIKDFVFVDGVHCIDINDIDAKSTELVEIHRTKRLKTKNAKRLVPIHPVLIDIGLLRYVEKLKKVKQIYFFPELSRTRRDGPAAAASNWFQKFRKSVGVGIQTKQEAVFHSFRHLFITTLLDSGISPHMVAPIVGHESDLITGQVYWNKKDAKKRQPTIDAFELTADVLALIPRVEEVRFSGKKLVLL